MFKIYDGREAFYQWDINQKLIVADDSITEVHFSNRTDNLSLVRDIYNEGDLRVVFVPNVLLQTNWPIKVYAYRKDHTEVSQTFRVIEKAKPQDYVYTPDEVKTWEELNNRVTALEKSGVSPEVIAKAVEDYLAEHPITSNIVSVNGQTGEVVLTASDVGALPADTEIPSIVGLASTEYVDNAIANIPAPDLSKCVQTDKENILADNGSIISNSSRGNSLTISNGIIEQKNSNQDTVSLGNAKVVFSHDNDGSSSTKGNGTFTMYGRKGEEYFKFNGTNGDVRVSGIATPTLSNDAVNKGYVDSQIANIEIPTVPTNVSAFTNDAGYLTAVPSEYVTETELNAKGYLTEHQSLADYALKSEIPSPYSLPTASATALGGVKVGTGLTIADDGTLSSNGAERIKYNFHSATLTDEDKAVLKEVIKNPVGDFTFDGFQVIDIQKTDSIIMFGVIKAIYNSVDYYGILYSGTNITGNAWQSLKKLYLSENQITGEIITADNFNYYFDQNFGWRIASSSSEVSSAKELYLFYLRKGDYDAFGTAYYNFRADDGIHYGTLFDYIASKFVLFYSPNTQSNVFWQYNGNDFELSTSDVSIERILYKS